MVELQSVAGAVLSNRYVLGDPVGSGTFGVVFRAHDVRSDGPVIVKVLRGPYGFVHLDSFRREIDSARRILHPSAVRIIDYGVADRDRPFLVMEAIEGESLSAWAAARRPLPIEACADVLVPIAELLAEAHSAGVVHCDVKPSHILIQHEDGGRSRPRLVDFGIARIARSVAGESGDETSGSPRRISGTPAYMSPERVLGGEYDGRADVYGLAIVLYELLTDRLPFDLRDDPESAEILQAQVRDRPFAVARFRPHGSPTLEAFLERCLAKDPSRRPTAAEFATYLKLERELALRTRTTDAGSGSSEERERRSSEAPTALFRPDLRRIVDPRLRLVLPSLDRCLSNGDLFGRFYERLTSTSPEIAERFRETDMEAQKRVLHHSINLVLAFFEHDPIGAWAIDRVRRSHSKAGLSIAPHLYEPWREAFLATVEELDPQMDDAIEIAWRVVLQSTIDYVTAGYDG